MINVVEMNNFLTNLMQRTCQTLTNECLIKINKNLSGCVFFISHQSCQKWAACQLNNVSYIWTRSPTTQHGFSALTFNITLPKKVQINKCKWWASWAVQRWVSFLSKLVSDLSLSPSWTSNHIFKSLCTRIQSFKGNVNTHTTMQRKLSIIPCTLTIIR